MAELSNKELNNNSILRFYPDNTKDDHYSAVYKNGKLYEVKNPDNRQKLYYNSIDDWLQSLPGKPTIDEIKNDIIKRIKKKKYNRINCKWAKYIYELIKQSSDKLFSNESVIDAYNLLTNFITKHHNIFIITNNYYKSYPNITLELVDKDVNLQINGLSYHLQYSKCFISDSKNFLKYTVMTAECKNMLYEFYNIYLSLYNLIASDVNPYIKIKQDEYKVNLQLRELNTSLKSYNRYLIKLCKRRKAYESQMMRRLDYYSKEINLNNSKIKEIENKLKSLNLKIENK